MARTSNREKRWALVLAAGEGTRVRSLCADSSGAGAPKQFCAFGGATSLLRRTIERAATVIAPDRIVTVVSGSHERWWGPELADQPRDRIVVQPANRGTAIGVLLPLLHIARHDPAASVVVFPSDHFIVDEAHVSDAIERAFQVAEAGGVVLLGITPDAPETSYGYIVPGPADPGEVAPVARFVEKPAAPVARELLDAGALWSSFLFVGRVDALLDLYRATLPQLLLDLQALLGGSDRGGVDLAAFYDDTPCRDFSRDVLEPGVAHLRVLSVPRCGWVDLGAPERLLRTLPRLREPEPRRVARDVVSDLG